MPTSPRTVDAECAPVWTASTSTECAAEVDAEAIRKHGMNFAQTDSRGKRGPTQSAPQPRKGSQNLGFGGVLFSLSFAAERKGAAGGIGGRRGITDCHSQCAHWLRNDTFFARGTVGSGQQGEGTPPYGNVSRSAVSGASGKSAKRCQWQMKRAGFEEVPRLAATTVAGNRLARRWAAAAPCEILSVNGV